MNKEIISNIFKEKFQIDCDAVIIAPGRVNIIGEHTDYNDGFVLPAAIDKAVWVAIKKREDNQLNFYAADLNDSFSTTINKIKSQDIEWANYILGALAQFQKKHTITNGFDITVASTIPIGAGLSSSAALSSGIIIAVNHVLNLNLPKLEMITMAQLVEHEYAGVKCGIMDMFASIMGKKDCAIKLDCASLEYEYIPLELGNHKLFLLNTNVKHNLASSEYNLRLQECEQGLAWMKERNNSIHSFRDATTEAVNNFVKDKSEIVYQRCTYVVGEIKRLLTACADLKNGNLNALGKKMYATHDGLSKQYAVSCKELDFLVNFVKDNEAVLGARMMGGGFGGCTINIIKEEKIDALITAITPAYKAATGLDLGYYVASIEDGARVV